MTTPTRTLADLRSTVSRNDFQRALRQAEFRQLPVDLSLLAPDRTASELEGLFLRLISRHHLPEPEVNVRVAGFQVDFLWRERRLVVETDGYRYHGGSAAFEADRGARRPARRAPLQGRPLHVPAGR